MALHSSPIKSNDVRLPKPRPGEALVVERYSAKHVLGARAHRTAELPEGELIDDEASVRRLLSL
jgi:hypothetical protein